MMPSAIRKIATIKNNDDILLFFFKELSDTFIRLYEPYFRFHEKNF